MKDFEFLTLAKLYNIAKVEVYNKHEDTEVFISKRKTGHDDVEETYRSICENYNHGEPMTNKKLFDFLQKKNKNSRVVL